MLVLINVYNRLRFRLKIKKHETVDGEVFKAGQQWGSSQQYDVLVARCQSQKRNEDSDVVRCGFSTVGKGQLEQGKARRLQHSGDIQLQKLFSEAQCAIDDFLSIDTVKSTPGSLSSMIKLLVRTLQAEPQHYSRHFYTQNKQKLDQFIYDLRSYNSQSWMTTQDLLLSFYLCKLAMDYGYQYVVTGFELRGGVRLLGGIVLSAGGSNSGQKGLTVNQTIFAMWIMSHMRFSNHEYKWKCLQYLQLLSADYSKRLMSQKRRLNSTDQLQLPIPPPFTLSQLSSVLQTYFMQQLHMSMEYQILEFVAEKLYVYRGYFLDGGRYDENPEVYVEVFTQLLGLEMGFLNGRKFYELQEVVRVMAGVMYRKIGGGLFGDEHVLEEFIGCRSVEDFIGNTKWVGFSSEAKPNTEVKQSKQEKSQHNITALKASQQQTYRSFLLLNQIRQNNQWFSIISKQDCSKLHYLLFEQLYQAFSSLQASGMSLQLRSLKLRTWLHQKQYEMESLQMEIKKISDAKEKTQKIKAYVEGLVGEFDRQLTRLGEVLKVEMERNFGVGVDNRTKKRREKYLLAEEKEGLRLKMAFVRNLQQSFFKPLTDFLYSNGKPTIMNSLLIGRQKLHMIQKLQNLTSDVLDTQDNTEVLECENRYFWMFKFMRLDSVNCTDNRLLLKQFQLLIQEQIGDNLKRKQIKVYSVVTVYNMYAYMCKLEERMLINEELAQRSQHSERSEQSSVIQSISKKKEYSFFLAYKTYLASLIYSKQSPEDKQTKPTKIPTKYLIQTHYTRQVPQSHYFSHYQGRSALKTQHSTTFSIELFFNIVFKANRYYSHKILSEELLLYLFGTEEALGQNLMKYILNTNQRSGENLYELMYVMFLAENTEIGAKDIHHTLTIKAIKTRLIQACSEKAKGSLFNLILRDIVSPRKTSFLKKNPLKYRGKPYSIFEALSKESCQRKMQIMHEFLESFSFNKNMVFGIVEMIFLNLEAWGQDKSQITNKVVLPWLANRIKSKDVVEANVHYFVLLAFRLVRFQLTKIDKSSEKLFRQFFLYNLCPLFQQLSSDDKSYSYNRFKGYLTEIQHLNKLSKLPKQTLHEILVSCMDYHKKNTGNGSNTRNETYLKFMEVFERLIKTTGQTRYSQVDVEYTSLQRKMFRQQDKQNSREGKTQVRQVRKGGMFGKDRAQ